MVNRGGVKKVDSLLSGGRQLDTRNLAASGLAAKCLKIGGVKKSAL